MTYIYKKSSEEIIFGYDYSMDFLECLFYVIILGVLSYPAGRLISRRGPDPESFPFREWAWEKGGKIYDKLNIRKWKNRIPDISRVPGRLLPGKTLSDGFSPEKIRIMIRETCTAEVIHSILSFLGLHILHLWEGTGGRLVCLVYVLLGNLPFIIVQRYNRPRLKKMLESLLEKESRRIENEMLNREDGSC